MDKPLRVLVVTSMYPPQHLGGYELVAQGAVRAMRDGGHDVTVLTTDTRLREAEEEDEGVRRALRWWWRDHAFPSRGLRERLAIERHDTRVLRECATGVDVVTWWAMGGMPMALLGASRLPSVAFVHDDWPLYGPLVDQRPWFMTGREGFDPVGEWLFVSEHTRRRVIEHGQLATDAVTGVASSGIDAGYLESGPSPPREWAWRLLVVGRIDERKGIATAVEAVALAPAQATLTVVGEGDAEHLATLRQLSTTLGVAERCHFVGSRTREELKPIYAEHDAVLFPVRWDEPWGLVPLEAMARGRPVVATGRGGSAEYLRDGENALLAPADDAPAFAAALNRLAADPELRGRLRDAGIRTASAHTEDDFHEAVLAAVARAPR